uniref:Condensin complex subunit 2 n=1 Tax=Macrostomum lignano TaxID=282301 RepID=A0A1I8HGJ5_9PLAT
MASAGEGPTALTLTRRLSARQLSEYENCMRLSAEGKISAKNAFALNLIDYLEGLVKGDCEFSNFQLASSSLDAGAKIYAGRVDAVHREAYKVMAELGRSSATAAGGVDSGVEDEGGSGEPVAPKRSRTSQANQQPRSRKSVDPARLARIRLKPSSLRFDLDPLFHQQAAAYDESAAWELRLNAARVADNDCEILLDSDARLRIGDADEDSASTAVADCEVFTPSLQRFIGEGLLSPVGSSVSQSKGDQQQPPSSCSKQRRRRSELVSKRRQRRLAEAATADALNSSASSAFPDGRRRSRRLAGQDAAAVDVAPTPVAVDVVEQHEDEDLDEQEHTDAILEAAAADDSTEVVSSSTTTAEAEAAAASLLSDEASSVEVSTTRDPFADGVLEPPYKVARLDLAYARTAKRVDAKRLKRAMWQLVGGGGAPSSQSTTTSLQSSSFTQLLQQLPGIPAAVGACSGGELSVQLVFNCLLHLAGEQPDLSDILISGNYGSSTTTNTTSTSSNNSTR